MTSWVSRLLVGHQIVGVTSSCLPSEDLKDVMSVEKIKQRAVLTEGWA